MRSGTFFIFLLGFVAITGAFENMNGEYLTTPTPNAKGSFNTKWNDYPGGVEYFEVYLGPITSLYSQVWWKNVPAVQVRSRHRSFLHMRTHARTCSCRRISPSASMAKGWR